VSAKQFLRLESAGVLITKLLKKAGFSALFSSSDVFFRNSITTSCTTVKFITQVILSTTYLTRPDSRAGCCAVFFCTTRSLCRSLPMLACSSGLPILKPCSAANLTHRALYSALPLT